MPDDDEIYIVVDVETDGPVPGMYSLLSIGAVATTKAEEIGQFYRKLLPIKGAAQYPYTMAWWKTQPEAWAEATKDAEPAHKVMQALDEWVCSFGPEPIFVAHPTGFDYTFISWYFWKFLARNPFDTKDGGGRTLDLQSYAAGKLNVKLSDAHRTKLPKRFTTKTVKHSHKAIEDARGYGEILRNLLKS